VFDSLSDHSFSHSMNTHEPNMRFCLINGFLDSFSYRLGRVYEHASRASFVGPRLCPCDASIGSSHVVPLRDSRHFSNDRTRSFPRVNILRHVSKGDSKTSSSNQILHLVNTHNKLSTFRMYPSHGFPSIYRLTLWDPRLGHLSLSLLSYVGRMILDGEHEL
jgi:hypothetical protein